MTMTEAHDSMQTNVGIVDQLRLDGGRLRGMVRLGKSARARELADDIRDGIVRSLSVGYSIDDAQFDEDGETLRATRWTPFETSIVSVPADVSAGFYRSRRTSTMPDENVDQRPSRRERSVANDQRTMNAEII